MSTEDFLLAGSTVRDVRRSILCGELSATGLVEAYVDRIERYDQSGPEINAIVSVNPRAADRASTLDQRLADSGLVGPLHGVPVLIKDQFLTTEMPTTFGSKSFANFVPRERAEIVQRLRDAGAIVLAKTNLPDWALGFTGHSTIVGQTKNPYSTEYDSGGSSAGTAAGLAAGFGVIGIGSDTGGSVRVPSAFCNLFGLRTTTGLLSTDGMSPLVASQDAPGPIARSVRDLAVTLDVIAGPLSNTSDSTHRSRSYTAALDSDGLDGTTVGIFRPAFGDSKRRRERSVNSVCERAISKMADVGAEVIDPVTFPGLSTRLSETSLVELESRWRINGFLTRLEGSPYESVSALYGEGEFPCIPTGIETLSDAPTTPTRDPSYWRRVAAQRTFREELVGLLSSKELDVLAFPTVQRGPDRHASFDSDTSPTYPVNTPIAAHSSCPALSVPAGFTTEGLPVGLELLAEPFAERQLVRIGSAYEHSVTQYSSPGKIPFDVRVYPEVSTAGTA